MLLTLNFGSGAPFPGPGVDGQGGGSMTLTVRLTTPDSSCVASSTALTETVYSRACVKVRVASLSGWPKTPSSLVSHR